MHKVSLVLPPGASGGPAPSAYGARKADFASFLSRALAQEGLKLSKHAEGRMRARGITLSEKEVSGIARAVKELDEKGGRTSLLLTPRATILANVKNRTIITVLDADALGERVFTQIDSAVVIDR